MARVNRTFVASRLGSLLAILPLGVWTVNHLWDNLAAFQGAEAWEGAVTGFRSPLSHVLTMVVVLGPLVVHTVWGMRRIAIYRPNNASWPTYGNLKFLLQRLSAIGLLLFLGAHLWLAMIYPRFVVGRPEPFEDIAREMRFHAPTTIVYVLGCLGLAYHLGNGIGTFAWKWGFASEPESRRRADVVAMTSFLILLAMSWAAVYALWDAGAAFGPGEAH